MALSGSEKAANITGLVDVTNGSVEYFMPRAINASGQMTNISERECSKKSVQQGRSPFDARSVLPVREHGKRARTPLAAFFNIPIDDMLMTKNG